MSKLFTTWPFKEGCLSRHSAGHLQPSSYKAKDSLNPRIWGESGQQSKKLISKRERKDKRERKEDKRKAGRKESSERFAHPALHRPQYYYLMRSNVYFHELSAHGRHWRLRSPYKTICSLLYTLPTI